MYRLVVLLALLPLCAVAQAQESLSLSDAIAIGLESNFDIKMARTGRQIAERQNSWGMAGGLPSLSLSGDLELESELLEPTSGDLSASAAASLDWVLFGGFEVRATKKNLESAEELAVGGEELSMESTLHSIINSYFFVLLQQEMVKITETVVSISKDRMDQVEDAKSLGASGMYEYVQAKSAYLTDQSNHLKQQVALRDAVRSFNLLLSLPAECEWVFSEPVNVPQFNYSLETMTDKMLADNRTLKNQYIALKARDYDVKQSRASLYPTIGLDATMAFSNSSFKSRPESNYLYPSVGLSLSFNLFNGGKTRRGIDVAKLNREIEQTSTEQMTLALESELASQYDGYNIYRDIVTYDNEQVEVAKLLLDLSEDRAKRGLINSFDFREVQLEYLESASSRLNSIYSLIVANTELLRLTGGILSYAK